MMTARGKRITYDPPPGTNAGAACITALRIAKAQKAPVTFTFNGHTLIARPWDRIDEVLQRCQDALNGKDPTYY